jgi:cobalt-zinc-cadmium efflux system outer membrane protein
MKTVLSGALLFFFVLIYGPAAFPEGPGAGTVLDGLIEEAVGNNPELKALKGKVEAFEEKPSQVKSLDDPRLSLALMNVPVDTFRFDQEPMTQKQISLMQKLPFPGKLQIKADMAERDVEIARQEFAEKRNGIVMQVKVVYRNLLFTDKAVEIAERNRELLREFINIAETRYSTGSGLLQDVMRSQLELTRMTDRILTLEQKRQTLTARLNTLLNRPVETPFEGTGETTRTGFSLAFDDLRKIAEENRPALIGLKNQVDRYHLAHRLAGREYYPDFDLGVSYGQRDDNQADEKMSDFMSAFVTVNIPLWYKTNESKKVAEEEANMRRSGEQYNSARNEIYFQIKDILTEIEKYDREIDLYKTGLIPQGTLSLESALAAYKVNKVDFLTLVNNQMALYNYEIEYIRVITDRENKLAELETAVGARLF